MERADLQARFCLFVEGKETRAIASRAVQILKKVFSIPAPQILLLFPESLSEEERGLFAERLVKMRIINPFQKQDPEKKHVSPVEKNYELRRIRNSSSPAYGVPYDGFLFAELAKEVLRKHRGKNPVFPVIITDQLLMTFDENDRRYHARYLILWNPCVISLGGLVEGPAKPRSYYIERTELSTAFQPEVADALIRKKYTGLFLVHGDERMPEVVAGCIIQALFYMALGEGFCTSPECRLYNFHFQEELIKTHAVRKKNLCERHSPLLKKLQEMIK